MSAARILSVYVDHHGVAWVDPDFNGATSPCADFRELLRSQLYSQAGEIRVLGAPCNAPLIAEHHRVHPDKPLFLAGPAGARCDRRTRLSPAQSLQAMRRIGSWPSCGGWHRMRAGEVDAYALSTMVLGSGYDASAIDAAYDRHPAALAIGFIPTADTAYAKRLLAEWLDPRWCVDPADPDSDSMLNEHLGLRTQNMLRLHDPSQTSNDCLNLGRAETVLMSWYDKQQHVDIRRPENFLYRIMYSKADRSVGLRRACRAFVRFVRDVWLDALCPHRELFVPEYFFKREDEAKAFRSYASVSQL